MEITILREQGRVPVTVLSLRGEFDTSSADQLEKCAKELVEAGARHLLINLEQAPHLNRIGLVAVDRVLFSLLANQSREERCAMYAGICAGTFRSPYLKLANLEPAALQALHLAGSDMYLEVHDDLKAAIASFGPTLPEPKKEAHTFALTRPVRAWLRGGFAIDHRAL